MGLSVGCGAALVDVCVILAVARLQSRVQSPSGRDFTLSCCALAHCVDVVLPGVAETSMKNVLVLVSTSKGAIETFRTGFELVSSVPHDQQQGRIELGVVWTGRGRRNRWANFADSVELVKQNPELKGRMRDEGTDGSSNSGVSNA